MLDPTYHMTLQGLVAGAWMLDPTYHMTLKLLKYHILA